MCIRDREYTLVLESQLGPRQGSLKFGEREGAITGTLTLLGHDNEVRGTRTGAGSIRLFHHLHTAVSDLVCVSDLEMDRGRVTGMLHSGQVRMSWHGEQFNGKAGENDNE